MKTSTYPASKPRYEILDGLRGVAAMLVVAYHLFETYYHGGHDQPVNHGYLAVDFFFVLSGFVIGYAYDDRWNKMTTWSFFKRRLIRLHPMLVMGTLIGAVWFYFGDAPGFEKVAETPVWLFLVCVVMGCLMLPTPPQMDIRGWQEMNSLNGAVWSLFWEYIANIIYALFIRRFSRTMLCVFVAFSALLTINFGMNLQLIGQFIEADVWGQILPIDINTNYTFVGGFGLQPQQLLIGATRLLYPFFVGLLISRLMYGKPNANPYRHGFLICSLAVIIVLCMPRIGGETDGWQNGLYETLSILIIFPLIVALGAKSRAQGKRAFAWCKFLGDISYPLYVTHYPLIYLQMKWAATHSQVPLEQHISVAVLLFIFAVAVAYASLKLYDLPVREWLKKKWFKANGR